MSLPLLHAGRTNPGLSAALDLRFALDKSLTAYRGPTPSFSRASTGSYFDGSGVLRYANVNIQPYSEQFSSWSFENSLVSSDVAMAPDGKTTADKVYETSATGEHNRNYNNTAAVGTYTLSFYIKPAGRNWAAIYIYHPSIGRGHRAWFDVQNGVVGTTAAIGAGLTGVSSGMVSAGNGWYRCWLTATTATTDLYSYIGLAQSNGGATNYAGDGSSGSFVWGAQLEASSTVGTYCPTTSAANSAPRFDHTYNGTSWVSRGLLVEEQRTNICLQSNTFNTTWLTLDGSVSANAATSPDGTNNAWKLNEGSGNTASHGIYQPLTIGTGNYTWSVYAKAGERSWLQFLAYSSSTNYFTWFNLANGTVGTNAAGTTASIQDVGGGWYRCSVSRSTSAGTSYAQIFAANADNNGSYAGDPTKGIYIYGCQVEAGSFPTSYIGTTTSSTTRSADVCQITGGDFSGFWNGTEGSVAVEFDQLADATKMTNESYIYGFQNAADTEQFILRGQSSGVYYWRSVNSGNIEATAQISSLGTATVKHAACYKLNDFASTFNGAAVVSDTSGATPNPTALGIGFYWPTSSNRLNGHIARLRYFNKRLPNATLQLLSEPDPTLNLQFALNKSLTPVAGPAPSFSRASTGTYFNASGILTSASINTPRFDHVYSGGQWVSKGLLVEEQRTNSARHSEDLTNAYWTKYFTTISSNSATAPDGNQTADKIIENTSNNQHSIFDSGFSVTAGTAYTISFFAKSAGRNFIQYVVADPLAGSGVGGRVNFNLSNGTIGQVVGNNLTAEITDVGNGWYRCTSKISSAASNGTGYLQFAIVPSATSVPGESYIGDGSSGVLLWGIQLESGNSFATSYIPVTSSSVTRSADVCQITGTNFNWVWNQGEGSVASEFDFLAAPADRVSPRVWYASDGAYTNGMWVQSGASDGFYVYQSGSSQAGLTATALGAGVSTKVSSAYKLNDFAASFNGASALTDTTGNVPTVNRMEVGFMSDISGRIINGHIAKLIYYPARLTNTKLQQLST